MRVYSTNMTSLLILTLIIWLQVIFFSFLHCKVLLVPHFPYRTLCKEVTVLSPHLRSETLSLTCVRGKYLNKLSGILLHQRFVSSPPFYSVWAHGYLFYIWVIIQYAILFNILLTLFQLWPQGALSLGSCVPFKYPHRCGFVNAVVCLFVLSLLYDCLFPFQS